RPVSTHRPAGPWETAGLSYSSPMATEPALGHGHEITVGDFRGEWPLERVFGRQAPVELELGCGKGRFIIRSAEMYPERDFLAVERANRFFRIAAERAGRRSLANLKLIRTDALELTRLVLPAASLRAVHVLFPDPWPKKRHHKRRLFRAEFAAALERILVPGGVLNVATDHAAYFSVIQDLISGREGWSRSQRFALEDRLPAGESGHTNYEVKYRREGRPIQQATWQWRGREAKDPEGTEASSRVVEYGMK
ncbi:MAG: tRNA (guanosine(46)-N7)-methyltransferase TrmB, partial [Acidobacteriota bacterium]